MDEDKAIRAAKLTLGAVMDKRRAKTAKDRAGGQIAPSKYLPGVPRQVHADGGEVTNLGEVREQKQMQTFHTGVMGDIRDRMTQAMEAHQKAVDAGHFDGYEVGDVLKGNAHPMRITGRYVQKWKPTPTTLAHFDRMGAKPTIIEHEGQQYIPMLRYQTGVEGEDGFQEGTVYLDGVKAAGYQKMGGLRAVKADGGSIHLIHGGGDFDEIDKRFSGMGEPGNIRPLGNGLYTYVIDPDDPETAKSAIGWAKRYAAKYGRGKKTLHVFKVPKSASTFFNGSREVNVEGYPKPIAGLGAEPQDKLDAYRAHRATEPAHDDPAWWDWSRKGSALYEEAKNAADLRMEHLPMGLTEAAINNPKIAQRIGKFDLDADPDEIIKSIHGYARGGQVSFQAGNHPDVPEVLYHGTAPRIVENQKYHGDGNWTSEVDQEATDRNIAAHDFREFMPSKYGNYGPGIYLTDRPETASQYAMGIRADQSEPKPHGSVMKLHVSMKKPFTDATLRHPEWRDYIKRALTRYSIPHDEDRAARDAILKALDNGTATVRDLFVRESKMGTLVNQHGQHDIHDTIRNSGFDGIIAHRPDGSKEYVAFKPEQVKSALSAKTYDPTNPDMTFADGGYVPQKTQKAYKLFRTKGDGKLYPLFVHADKPVEMGKWLEAEEGPQGKTQGKVKSKLGDLAYRPGWHAGDLPIATHIGGKSDPSLKKPDYRPDNHVWAEVEMAADKDWQAEANSRGKGVKAHITDQVPAKGFYRYKTNPNMTGNWLIGGNMKVNRVLSDDEVKAINDAAGVADLPRLDRTAKADGGSIAERSPMFEGMSEHLLDDEGKPMELWHGTPGQPFEAFDDSKIGVRDPGFYGRGHYLTPIKGNAEGYADPDEMGTGTVMGPMHAALKNPYIWDASSENSSHRTLRDLQSMGIMKGQPRLEPWDNLQPHHINPFMAEMQKRGHDGVIVKMPDYQNDRPHRVTEVVVFKPSAVKHRDAEVGDPNDPRIMRNLGGRLYSRAAKIMRGMKDQPMQVDDIIKYATGKGAKKAEIEYTDPPRGGMARPSQVAQHLEDMQPQIGVQRREVFYRYNDPEKYERQINYLEGQRRFDEAEELNREYEAFSGFGGKDAPLYAKYQLPGGENYREHILTLDNHTGPTYTAPIHWSNTPNPLAHIRMSDRMIGNKKILHIEEVQSDWNNDARRLGFSTGREQQDYDDFVANMRQKAIDKVKARTGQDYYDPITGETAPTMSPMVAQAQIEKYQRMDPYMLAMKMGVQEDHRRLAHAATGKISVPRAPYINPDRDDASELAIKHILMEAAKGGYDGIAFTPDEAQEQRWKGTKFNGIYNKKLPGMAQKLVQQHDTDTDPDDMTRLDGWAVPMIPLTDKARDSINQNGFSSFRRGGYVTHVRRAR